MDSLIYLDHAATTPLDAGVFAAMQPYFGNKYFNPSATYMAARAVKQDIEAARARVAYWFGSRPSEVVFTAGGTEANNLAIHGVLQQYPEGNVVVSAIEHEAVLKPASQYDHRIAAVQPDGVIDVDTLLASIDDQTVLVSVMYVNNELGTVQPLRAIAQKLQDIRTARRKQGNPLPLLFHTDACQASLYLDLHAVRLGVDLLTINAGKMYGPKQVGALYIRAGVSLRPQLLGGGQERGYRSGTENVPGIIGLAAALDVAQAGRHDESARLAAVQKLSFELIEELMPHAVINGSRKQRVPSNIHLTLPGTDNERVMMQLDERGIAVAVGSACSASNEEPSHVLKAIGLSDADAYASLRLTMGRSTDEAVMRHVIAALSELM